MASILTGPTFELERGGCGGQCSQDKELDWGEINFWTETQPRGIGAGRTIGGVNYIYRPDAHYMMHYTAWTHYADYMRRVFDINDLEVAPPDDFKMVVAEDWFDQFPKPEQLLDIFKDL